LAGLSFATHIHTVATHSGGLARLLAELPGRIPYGHLKDWVRTGAGWTAAAVGDTPTSSRLYENRHFSWKGMRIGKGLVLQPPSPIGRVFDR